MSVEPQVWPVLDDAAMHGPLGEWVALAAGYTEADPAAVLATGLVATGVAAGNLSYMRAGNARQAASLFALIVADTPKANRGLSWAIVRELVIAIDPHLGATRTLGGLGSGRGVIDALVGPPPHGVERTGPPPFPGANDRLLVIEPGFVRALATAAKPTSSLQMLIRNAWSGERLEVAGRGRKAIADRHHIGVVAHATLDQLGSSLSLTNAAASLINRFLFVLARRQGAIVDEGNVPTELTRDFASLISKNLAKSRSAGQLQRTPDADELWRDAYARLAEDDPGGLLGIALARGSRHAMRLSLVYALCDGSPVVDVHHVQAGLAFWGYCRASAELILAGRQRDLAGELLAALEAAGAAGLTLSEQIDYFGRNVPAERLKEARRSLEAAGLVASTRERRSPAGRPATITRAIRIQRGAIPG